MFQYTFLPPRYTELSKVEQEYNALSNEMGDLAARAQNMTQLLDEADDELTDLKMRRPGEL